jgi:hypothetical protein
MERTITLTEKQARFLFDLLSIDVIQESIFSVDSQEQAYEISVTLSEQIWGA